MTDRNKAIERLRKLLALARQGKGGEKVNAQTLLDRLMRQHGLTLADLETDDRQKHYLAFRGAHEKILAIQTLYWAANDPERVPYTYKSKRNRVYADLTAAERLQADLAYDLWRKALRKQFDRTLNAFLAVNRVYGPTSDAQAEASEPMPDDEFAELMMLMGSMRPTPVHRPLPAA